MKAELPLYGCYIQSQKWAASNITHPSTPSSYPRGLEKHSIYLTLQQQLPVCKFDCQRLFIHCRLERWGWVTHAGKPPKKEPLFLYITSPPLLAVCTVCLCVLLCIPIPPLVYHCVCVCVEDRRDGVFCGWLLFCFVFRRTTSCTHLQCFDASIFYQMNEKWVSFCTPRYTTRQMSGEQVRECLLQTALVEKFTVD